MVLDSMDILEARLDRLINAARNEKRLIREIRAHDRVNSAAGLALLPDSDTAIMAVVQAATAEIQRAHDELVAAATDPGLMPGNET